MPPEAQNMDLLVKKKEKMIRKKQGLNVLSVLERQPCQKPPGFWRPAKKKKIVYLSHIHSNVSAF